MIKSTRRKKTNNFKLYVQRSIRQMRLEKKLTQKQLAEKLGVDQASVSNYESGKTEMTCTQLFELFLIFGKDLSNVFDLKNSNIEDVPIEEQKKE
ncbi:helix-turn-helix transcriptional regulator [Pseudoalteromonas aurantia]|uniref:XRE family transcriptional regulator n=1 Tax=Pseudoalteromonas aurantia TaxID=43654 RepID=A0A5S3VCX6_9GAMM|nr:helix-turn-helix transcriptional regulator [Pseudoalteromonas aurantia]TMO60635.1 XRE family transcriptional regulator [Pseudoalteromonas aurantia]TMO70070.1 XRE family transcriptional regulator [Pseudoalteromonas aurantia]TMO76096.1 XRE family transcriptional regulator [Pseudoalteromonas aurantia]